MILLSQSEARLFHGSFAVHALCHFEELQFSMFLRALYSDRWICVARTKDANDGACRGMRRLNPS